MIRLIQTVLRSPTGTREGYIEMTCWLPRDRRVKVGTVITLKDDDTKIRWKVFHQGMQMTFEEINRRWNVGGL